MTQNLEGLGFTVVPFGQGFKDMSPSSKELMKLTLEEKLAHGGHLVLRWMMDNIHVRTDPAGNIKPDKEKSTEKIDGAVATIMALDRAIRRSGTSDSVYDDRGLLFFWHSFSIWYSWHKLIFYWGDSLMSEKSNNKIKVNEGVNLNVYNDKISINIKGTNKLAFVNYTEELLEIIKKARFRIPRSDKAAADYKYPYSNEYKKTLHQIVIDYYFGEEVRKKFYESNYIIEHLDNDGFNCDISNLFF